jgi:hypothetical protein
MHITRLQCDSCGKQAEKTDWDGLRSKGWAECRVDLSVFDYCPDCWKSWKRPVCGEGLPDERRADAAAPGPSRMAAPWTPSR